MRIRVAVKRFGASRTIGEREFDIPDVSSMRELVAALVRQETAAYNARPDGDTPLVLPLAHQEVETQAVSGKVAFGRRRGKKADAEKAVAAALQAYEDGLFKVFVGDDETGKLDDRLELRENDKLTFIRLMLLSGR